jgi:hypothetical protein
MAPSPHRVQMATRQLAPDATPNISEQSHGIFKPMTRCGDLSDVMTVLVVTVPLSFRGATAVRTTVHSAPSPAIDRRRLAWPTELARIACARSSAASRHRNFGSRGRASRTTGAAGHDPLRRGAGQAYRVAATGRSRRDDGADALRQRAESAAGRGFGIPADFDVLERAVTEAACRPVTASRSASDSHCSAAGHTRDIGFAACINLAFSG